MILTPIEIEDNVNAFPMPLSEAISKGYVEFKWSRSMQPYFQIVKCPFCESKKLAVKISRADYAPDCVEYSCYECNAFLGTAQKVGDCSIDFPEFVREDRKQIMEALEQRSKKAFPI